MFGAVYVWCAAGVTVCWLCRRSVGVSEHPKQWMIRRIVLGWVRSFPWESLTVLRLRSREVGIKQLVDLLR
ncbi:MAG: hypothetical protein QOJ58_5014 [Alphaproteobacteria bacterium]|nr:hypothetical protein [Alphaproteobacteria bacterium]